MCVYARACVCACVCVSRGPGASSSPCLLVSSHKWATTLIQKQHKVFFKKKDFLLADYSNWPFYIHKDFNSFPPSSREQQSWAHVPHLQRQFSLWTFQNKVLLLCSSQLTGQLTLPHTSHTAPELYIHCTLCVAIIWCSAAGAGQKSQNRVCGIEVTGVRSTAGKLRLNYEKFQLKIKANKYQGSFFNKLNTNNVENEPNESSLPA